MKAKFINEILKADDKLFNKFKSIIFEIKDLNINDPFYELNLRLNPLSIEFIDYYNFMNALNSQERSQFKNANMIPELGIRILGFDETKENIFILVDESFDDKFLEISTNRLDNLLNFMWAAFGHETIHKQQVAKMKIKQKQQFKTRDVYFKNKQEVMAMAFSFIEEMRNTYSDKEILNILKGNNTLFKIPSHPLLNIYKNLDDKSYKMFTKCAYKYLISPIKENLSNIFIPKSTNEITEALKKTIEEKLIYENIIDEDFIITIVPNNVINLKLSKGNYNTLNNLEFIYDFYIHLDNSKIVWNVSCESMEYNDWYFTDSGEKIFENLFDNLIPELNYIFSIVEDSAILDLEDLTSDLNNE